MIRSSVIPEINVEVVLTEFGMASSICRGVEFFRHGMGVYISRVHDNDVFSAMCCDAGVGFASVYMPSFLPTGTAAITALSNRTNGAQAVMNYIQRDLK